MSTLSTKAEDLKTVLRGLLICTPQAITVDQLERDFKLQEGRHVPFRELGYPTFLKYLESIPDTLVVQPSWNGGCPLVIPAVSKKSSHIDVFVNEQKANPPKRSSHMRHRGSRRSFMRAPPETNSTYYSTNYNSTMKQRIFLPASLQQRVCRMVNENPQGVLVQAVERELLSSPILQNYGIQESCDVHQLLGCLSHVLKISNGVVYPLQNDTPPQRPTVGNPVTENKRSNNCNSETYRFIPAGWEGEVCVISKQNGTMDVHNELSSELSHEDDAEIAEAIYRQTEVTDNVEELKDMEEDLKVIPESGSPSDDTGTCISAFTSDIVGKKMKMNFQILLDKHPSGIWCSELPDIYKKEFAVALEYANFGFVSVIQMASNLPDVFHCIRPDGTDWKLLDARKRLPPHYSAYDIKCNKNVSTKMVPMVPSKVRLNIKKLVSDYPSGIPSEHIPHLYKEEFLTTLNVQDMGFHSMETFLLALGESVLHMRYVNKKILVYPLAHDTEPEKDNPLPHITEPEDHILNLYPPEVVGPKGTLTHEKIPPEAVPGGFIEVLVAEIYTPLNFWVQLRGENTHMALDRLMNDMQLFFRQEADNYNMPVATVKIGQYCVAPYNGEWHRACITAVHNLIDVQVHFVDYGTAYRVKKSELRFLHMDFASFPMQAIKASLANIVPVGGEKKWPRRANERFLELVSDKNLVAVVSSVDHEARKLEVALVDTSGNEDIHINDLLVNEGLAEYKTRRLLSPLPPQPKRIDADPVATTVAVSRPPPGFTATSELHNQPLLSPTSSAAPGQNTYVLETQTSLPVLPMANTTPSNFIPSVPIPYDVSLLTNSSSLMAQSSMLQQFALYEHLLQQEQLIRSLAYLASQNVGAPTLVSPFTMPVLNPSVMYTPTPVFERMANVRQSELGVSEVLSAQNASEQMSPSGTGQLAAAADVSASVPVTSGTHMSSGISQVSVVVDSSPELGTADAHCDEESTLRTMASQKEVTAVNKVTNEQQQNKDELVHKALNSTVSTEFSSASHRSDNTSVKESRGLESESDVGFESQCVNEGNESGADLSTNSDEIYRSDDEDDEEGGVYAQQQSTLRESKYVKQIEIAGRVIHLVKIGYTVFLCTEEVVRHFTDFSGRHVVLKILDSRGVRVPFSEIGRQNSPAVISDLDAFDVEGVPKSPNGYIIGKVHLTPLTSVRHLIPLLNVEDREEFCNVMASGVW